MVSHSEKKLSNKNYVYRIPSCSAARTTFAASCAIVVTVTVIDCLFLPTTAEAVGFCARKVAISLLHVWTAVRYANSDWL